MRLTGKWPSKPGKALFDAVRVQLLLRGSSLTKWCKEHDVGHAWAWQALMGTRKGPAAKALIERIVKDAKGDAL